MERGEEGKRNRGAGKRESDSNGRTVFASNSRKRCDASAKAVSVLDTAALPCSSISRGHVALACRVHVVCISFPSEILSRLLILLVSVFRRSPVLASLRVHP